MLVPDLRPLSVGEIIDVAIKIWRRQFGTLARIVIVVVTPVQILSTLVASSVDYADLETFDPVTGEPTFDGGAFAGFLAGMGVAQLLAGLAFLISSAAVLRAVSVGYLGGVPDWRDSLRAATGRIGSLIWLAFLMFGGLILAGIALILPAVWLGVAWSVCFPVLIAEGQRGTKALRRSFHLVKGRWWPTFGALFLAFLLQGFIGLVLGLPLGFLTADADSGSLSTILLTIVVGVVSSVITTPLMAAVLVLIYFDLRVRKEGFDLQLLSQGVGIPGDSLPAGAPWLAGGTSGGHWGGAPGNWGQPAGGNWPPPGGGSAGAGYDSPSPGGGSPPPRGSNPPGGWPAGGSGWAPPGSGTPTGDPTSGPPAAPRFEDPIDPTGPGEETPPPGEQPER